VGLGEQVRARENQWTDENPFWGLARSEEGRRWELTLEGGGGCGCGELKCDA